MALFIGEFSQTIDDKRRLAINAPLRELTDPQVDGENFILVLSAERRLWLYPDKYYKELISRLKRSPLPTRGDQKLVMFFASMRYLKADKQGRVVLPDQLVQRVKLTDEVTLVGHVDHIEIWPRQEWEQHVEQQWPTYGEALLEAGDRLAAE